MHIDLYETIKAKNPKLAKKLPGFVIKLIGKIIHLNQMNDILDRCEGKRGADFAEGVLNCLSVRRKVTVVAPEKIDKEKKYIFVSNHPLGGLDGLIITSEINERFGPAKFLVNNILMAVEPLRDIFVPVNNLGTAGKQEINGVKALYQSSFHVLNFPAGACSRLIKGEIKDLAWRKSFVREAVKANRDIIPIYFQGRNSKRFYWTAKLRTALGIKAFIEMFLLPDEMFRQTGNSFNLIIGEPISCEEIKNSGLTAQQWCDKIRNKVYEYGSSYSTR